MCGKDPLVNGKIAEYIAMKLGDTVQLDSSRDLDQLIDALAPRQLESKGALQALFNFVAYPGTTQIDAVETQLRLTYQAEPFSLETSLLSCYYFLIFDKMNAALSYFEPFKHLDSPAVSRMRRLIAYARAYMKRLPAGLKASEQNLETYYETTDFLLFDTLRDLLKTLENAGLNQDFASIRTRLLQSRKALNRFEERVAVLAAAQKSYELPAYLNILRALLYRFKVLEGNLRGFISLSQQLSEKLDYLMLPSQRHRLVFEPHYRKWVLQEVKGDADQLADQLHRLENQGYSIDTLFSFYLKLNEKILTLANLSPEGIC